MRAPGRSPLRWWVLAGLWASGSLCAGLVVMVLYQPDAGPVRRCAAGAAWLASLFCAVRSSDASGWSMGQVPLPHPWVRVWCYAGLGAVVIGLSGRLLDATVFGASCVVVGVVYLWVAARRSGRW